MGMKASNPTVVGHLAPGLNKEYSQPHHTAVTLAVTITLEAVAAACTGTQSHPTCTLVHLIHQVVHPSAGQQQLAQY